MGVAFLQTLFHTELQNVGNRAMKILKLHVRAIFDLFDCYIIGLSGLESLRIHITTSKVPGMLYDYSLVRWCSIMGDVKMSSL